MAGHIGEALFNEAMRKYPPVPFSPRYVVRDTTVDGYDLEAGTYVAVGPLVLHNDENTGMNRKFLPRRFLDPDYQIGLFFALYMFRKIFCKLHF